jgi:phage gpG-like protein
MISVILDDETTVAVLTGLSERLSPAGRLELMGRLAKVESKQVNRTIAEHGIDGAWPPLSDLTPPGGMLHRSGGLMDGIQPGDVTPDMAEVVSKAKTAEGVDYPAVQNFGMTIKGNQSRARGRYEGYGQGGLLSWIGPDGARFFAKEITIPARPFMVFRPEDPPLLAQMAASFLLLEEHL